VGLVAYFKLYAEKGLFEAMKQTGAILNIPMIAVVFVAFVSKRTPAIAANVALLTGMAFQTYFGIMQENHLFGYEVHWLHLAGINFVHLLVLMAFFRVLAPQRDPFDQKYTEDVDITPWKLAVPVSVITVLAIAAMYIGMAAKFGLVPGEQLEQEYEQLHPEPVAEATTESD
jgi:SSS family solute:Na+ symporter